MAAKPIFFVTKVDLKVHPNKLWEQPNNAAQPQEADFMPRAEGAPRPFRIRDNAPQPGQQPPGFFIAPDDCKDLNKAYNSLGAAQEAARSLAEKNPTVLYGVFTCCNLYETTVPTIIEKQFTPEGELRLME